MSRLYSAAYGAALLCLLTSGCGGTATRYPVTGTVKLKGVPVEGCKVIMTAADASGTDTQGFGFGVTDKSGQFTIQHPQGEKGLPVGKYKVGFVAWVNAKNGKSVPADAKPSEVDGGVRNIFGSKYEDPNMSPEALDVPKGGVEKVFDITP